MGWASGSELAEDIWTTVKKHIPEKSKKKVAARIVELFEYMDCDTIDEARGLMKAAGLEDRWNDDDSN